MEKYNPKEIEAKWQKYWIEHPELFAVNDDSKKEKKYILDMFPYPSGEGLHVGHVESYTATDIMSRYYRLQGKNVLHPQGWDAFGLPAENYAIKTKIHPTETTKKAIATFKAQMGKLGFSYDWSREVNSSDPEYYKWTQWFFLQLYKNKLAYKAKAKVNWCESCQTVLANEQSENGVCERCGNKVIQKDLEQWFFKITDFIEDKGKTQGLLSGLEKLDWPESTKQTQRNWIGRSEGTTIKFLISNSKFLNKSQLNNDKNFIEVFTTRVDTIFGCTYCVVAPEHKIVQQLAEQILNLKEVEKYLEKSKKKSDLMRMEAKEKTGVEIKGIKVINPFTNEEVSLFVADYVLAQYGTGAVMAVPAHDERDWEFAQKYKLPIKEVIEGEKKVDKIFTADGVLFDSGKFTKMISEKARAEMTKWLTENKLGSQKINYKLRDWLVSRQRYWGAPIPIIYCEKCAHLDPARQGEIPVPEENLPVMLPTDVDFNPTGESPLKKSKSFHNVKCPKCGGEAKRESDTMDTFVCSSWYYFRYSDSRNKKAFAGKEQIKKWLPVDLYVGGAEHTVLHLLYARFFTKVLHKLGHIKFDEPFLKLRHQGIILAEDGNKMAKSKGNVVNPDEVVEKFGADSLRMFEMFMGPLEDMKPWNTKGIVGIVRFLEKVYKNAGKITDKNITNKKLESLFHKTIKKITNDIESLRFNTAISQMMIFANELDKQESISKIQYEKYLILLSPFAPHIAEEIWKKLGHTKSIFLEAWPKYDEKLIQDEEIELVIQINGKVRDKLRVSADITEEDAKKLAVESEKIKSQISGKKIKKIIFVKGKLISIVI